MTKGNKNSINDLTYKPAFGAIGKITAYMFIINIQNKLGLYPTFVAIYVATILLLITGKTDKAIKMNIL